MESRYLEERAREARVALAVAREMAWYWEQRYALHLVPGSTGTSHLETSRRCGVSFRAQCGTVGGPGRGQRVTTRDARRRVPVLSFNIYYLCVLVRHQL